METDFRTKANKFYHRMNDLDTRKKFPNAVIIDHACSERFAISFKMMKRIQRLAMLLDVVKDERLQ